MHQELLLERLLVTSAAIDGPRLGVSSVQANITAQTRPQTCRTVTPLCLLTTEKPRRRSHSRPHFVKLLIVT
jgi:hypothetical protein